MFMSDLVWHTIDRELARRKDARLSPSSWSALGKVIGASVQATTNWKTRGVPPKEHPAIAAALGWSVDQLLGTSEPAPWPFEHIKQADWRALKPEDQGYIQGEMNALVKQILKQYQLDAMTEAAAQEPPPPPPPPPVAPPPPPTSKRRGKRAS